MKRMIDILPVTVLALILFPGSQTKPNVSTNEPEIIKDLPE